MEIVLSALADAILSLVVTELSQYPMMEAFRKKLLWKSPETVAFERALQNTYLDFQSRYSMLSSAFLDEHFLLKDEVITELAKILTPHRNPSLERLETAWRLQFTSALNYNLYEPLAYFLNKLDEHIKDSKALMPFTDSKALNVIAENSERQARYQKELLDLLAGAKQQAIEKETEIWRGSPYPGLVTFNEKQSAIFFGRSLEIQDLITELQDPKKLSIVIVGASGSGKSSLVKAGLIPELRNGAIRGSDDWFICEFTPAQSVSGDPFVSLANALAMPPFNLVNRNLAQLLRENPLALHQECVSALPKDKGWAQCLLFIDQFEELFTRTSPEDRDLFLIMLIESLRLGHLRMIATIRHDLYSLAIENQTATKLLKFTTYPLSTPSRQSLREIIVEPAKKARLRVEKPLVNQILDDAGRGSNPLTLVAFVLHQLTLEAVDDELTLEAYQSIGGLEKAIGRYAKQVFDESGFSQETLFSLFRELVTVNEQGIATKRRVSLQEIDLDLDLIQLIGILGDARLLEVSSEGVIELVHEALLHYWPDLSNWFASRLEQLRTSSELLRSSEQWVRHNRNPHYLLSSGRLELAVEWLNQERLHGLVTNIVRHYIIASKRRRAIEQFLEQAQKLLDLSALCMKLKEEFETAFDSIVNIYFIDERWAEIAQTGTIRALNIPQETVDFAQQSTIMTIPKLPQIDDPSNAYDIDIVIPVIPSDVTPICVIHIQARNGEILESVSEDFLKTFSDQFAMIVQNAMLFDSAQEALAETAQMYALVEQIAIAKDKRELFLRLFLIGNVHSAYHVSLIEDQVIEILPEAKSARLIQREFGFSLFKEDQHLKAFHFISKGQNRADLEFLEGIVSFENYDMILAPMTVDDVELGVIILEGSFSEQESRILESIITLMFAQRLYGFLCKENLS